MYACRLGGTKREVSGAQEAFFWRFESSADFGICALSSSQPDVFKDKVKVVRNNLRILLHIVSGLIKLQNSAFSL